MVEFRFVIRCYLPDGYSDYFSDECNAEDFFDECLWVECMTISEWYAEDCYATDDPDEEEECLDLLDEAGVLDYEDNEEVM